MSSWKVAFFFVQCMYKLSLHQQNSLVKTEVSSVTTLLIRASGYIPCLCTLVYRFTVLDECDMGMRLKGVCLHMHKRYYLPHGSKLQRTEIEKDGTIINSF